MLAMLILTVALAAAAAIAPMHPLDPWKATLWIALLVIFGLSAAPYAGAQSTVATPTLVRTVAALLLGVIAIDAQWGRRRAKQALPVLPLLGVAWVFMAEDNNAALILLPLQTALLLLATGVFIRLELQRRPGAGWILLGVLLWLIRLWLPQADINLEINRWLQTGCDLLTAVTFMLAVRKQLRLSGRSLSGHKP